MGGFLFAFAFLPFRIFATLVFLDFFGYFPELLILLELGELLAVDEIIYSIFLLETTRVLFRRTVLSTFSNSLVTHRLAKLKILL